MKINDMFPIEQFNNIKPLKLKGHVKLTLHNCRTGKNEVHEGENIITHAVRDIMANNPLGALNYGNLLPLWSKWYGGCLLYQNAHTINADNYFCQDDGNNPLVAHAGDQAPSSAAAVAEDYGRGAPVSVVTGENSIKQTWEWGTAQGNLHGGVISAISLTHKDTGNAGLGNTSTEFQNFVPFEHIEFSGVSAAQYAYADGNAFAKYDDNHTLFFYIGDDNFYLYNSYNVYSFAGTNKVTIFKRRMAYGKAGLYETLTGRTDYQSKTTVTTSITFYSQPCYYYDPSIKYLWLFSNMTASRTYSTSVMSYTVIDVDNGTEVDHGTLTNSNYTTYPFAPISGRDNTSGNSIFRGDCYIQLIKDGNYVYLPLGNGSTDVFGSGDPVTYHTGWLKIDVTNQTDQEVISFGVTNNFTKPAMKGGDLLVGFTHVVNNGVAYKCGSLPYGAGNNGMKFLINEPKKISSLASLMPQQMSSSSLMERWILAHKMVNTSLYNLPNGSVTKTATQSMTLEYTLTEV